MKATREFVEKYYTDDLAEKDSVESRWAQQWLKEVGGDSILDIGCGPQLFDDVVEFKNLPKSVVGIDLNETNIEFLKISEHPVFKESKKILAEHGVRVEFFVWDIKVEHPDFIGHFDTVFASGLIGNFDEQETAEILSLIYKYLKPGGKFVMVSWGDDKLTPEKYKERNNYEWYWRKGPSPEKLSHMLENIGFSILKKDILKVVHPEEYQWGIIYGFASKK